MLKLRFAMTICVFITLIGCNKHSIDGVDDELVKNNVITTDKHSSQVSLDWAGTYQGILPCADCSGINTVITLGKDKTYLLTESYQGGENPTNYSYKGLFQWNPRGNIISLQYEGKSSSHYLVGENKLYKLDSNKVTGELTDHCILQKIRHDNEESVQWSSTLEN